MCCVVVMMMPSLKHQDLTGENLKIPSCRPIPEGYTVLREGKGAILRKGNDVFYNPAQARSVTSTAIHVASAARGVLCTCCL